MADVKWKADWTKVKINTGCWGCKIWHQNPDGSYSVRMFYQTLQGAGATVEINVDASSGKNGQVDISECKCRKNQKISISSGKIWATVIWPKKPVPCRISEENENYF